MLGGILDSGARLGIHLLHYREIQVLIRLTAKFRWFRFLRSPFFSISDLDSGAYSAVLAEPAQAEHLHIQPRCRSFIWAQKLLDLGPPPSEISTCQISTSFDGHLTSFDGHLTRPNFWKTISVTGTGSKILHSWSNFDESNFDVVRRPFDVIRRPADAPQLLDKRFPSWAPEVRFSIRRLNLPRNLRLNLHLILGHLHVYMWICASKRLRPNLCIWFLSSEDLRLNLHLNLHLNLGHLNVCIWICASERPRPILLLLMLFIWTFASEYASECLSEFASNVCIWICASKRSSPNSCIWICSSEFVRLRLPLNLHLNLHLNFCIRAFAP